MPRDSSCLQEAMLLLEVLKRIPLSRKITTSELFQQLEAAGFTISRRTLQRYLKALIEAEMGVTCDTKSIPYGYRRMLNSNDLDRVGLGPEGSLLLLLTREHLRYQMPPEMTKSLSYLFEAADRMMAEKHRGSLEKKWLDKVCFVTNSLPMLPPNIIPRIFNNVAEGLFQQKKLRITYKGLGKEETERTVSPLGLVQQDVRIYLVCSLEESGKLRHFAIHRMKEVEVTDFSAVCPDNFNLRDYVRDGKFIYGKKGLVRLELFFKNKDTARILQETPFNEGQTIEQLPDGSFKLTVVIEDSNNLKGWIESWREDAEIVDVKKTRLSEEK